jgi:hypothetical protein
MPQCAIVTCFSGKEGGTPVGRRQLIGATYVRKSKYKDSGIGKGTILCQQR